ncbi:MAG: hypothetical protein JWP87_6468 [Labilithrix sp.]|nr:hypothetical protein [Labilithrix sp.]
MKKLLSIALLAFPVIGVACTETVVNKTAPVGEPAATDPAATSDEAGTAGEADAAPAGDSCACPATCASTTEKGKMVCRPAKAPDDVPTGKVGKFTVGGFEYWQWKKGNNVYGTEGSELAWGYNGEGEPQATPPVLPSEPSRACMAEANKVLNDILAKDVPPELEAFRAKHGVSAFWQWNNDMTGAKAGVEPSEQNSNLWLYDKRLIKWISMTNRDGTCVLPTKADLVKFSVGCLTAFPNCANSIF